MFAGRQHNVVMTQNSCINANWTIISSLRLVDVCELCAYTVSSRFGVSLTLKSSDSVNSNIYSMTYKNVLIPDQ